MQKNEYKLKYKALIDDVKTILNKYDPIGLIAQGAPQDEYESEANLIVAKLEYLNNYFTVLFMIYKLFVTRFDFVTAGTIFNYIKIAKEVNSLRKRQV